VAGSIAAQEPPVTGFPASGPDPAQGVGEAGGVSLSRVYAPPVGGLPYSMPALVTTSRRADCVCRRPCRWRGRPPIRRAALRAGPEQLLRAVVGWIDGW